MLQALTLNNHPEPKSSNTSLFALSFSLKFVVVVDHFFLSLPPIEYLPIQESAPN